MPTLLIDDLDDPRLDGYRALRESGSSRRVDRGGDTFVVEGTLVLQALLGSSHRLRSVLVSDSKRATVEPLVAHLDVPLFVGRADLLEELVGFDLHRGVVALGERSPSLAPWDLVGSADLVLVVEGVNDHENLGALFRNAAAFGVDAVLLDPTTADPFYRRCLRVSLGHALTMPSARLSPWPATLRSLQEDGWTLLALTPDPSAENIDDVAATLAASAGASAGAGDRRPRVALLVGAEGPGLSAAARTAAGRQVRIPMAAGVDSLNVATAAAVALHLLRRCQ